MTAIRFYTHPVSNFAAKVEIVSGPTAVGAYTLALRAGADRAAALASSRRIDEVELRTELLRAEGRDDDAAQAQRRLDSLRAAEETRARRRGEE